MMRQSTAIPEPSFWLVRSGDAKIDCRIAGARCSENGSSGDKKITGDAFSLEIAGDLLEGGLRVCAQGEVGFFCTVLRKGTDKINLALLEERSEFFSQSRLKHS